MTEASHISTGKLGEAIAARYLERQGFSIVERNYRKKWGELDIVAEKDGVLHFIEVKSASCVQLPATEGTERYRPEDHMHAHKRARMRRVIETYVLEHRITSSYTADLVVVYVNGESRRAKVHSLWDIDLS